MSPSRGSPISTSTRTSTAGEALHVSRLRIRKETPPGRASRLEMPCRGSLPVCRRVRQRPTLRLTARATGKPILEYTQLDLREHSKTRKGCEEGCSVGCAFRCSLVDNDKPQFVKSVIKGFVKGTLRDNSRRRAPRTALRAEPALLDE